MSIVLPQEAINKFQYVLLLLLLGAAFKGKCLDKNFLEQPNESKDNIISEYTLRDPLSRVMYAKRWVLEGRTLYFYRVFRNDIRSLTGIDILDQNAIGVDGTTLSLFILDTCSFNNLFMRVALASMFDRMGGTYWSGEEQKSTSNVAVTKNFEWSEYFQLFIEDRIKLFFEHWETLEKEKLRIIKKDIDLILWVNTHSIAGEEIDVTMVEDIVAVWTARL